MTTNCGVGGLVVAGQLSRRPSQLARPGGYDIDDRRAQLLPDSAARLEVGQRLLASCSIRAREVLDHGLEKDELRDKHFILPQLPVEPVLCLQA